MSQLDKFLIAGINYKKTDASVRGQFAINHEQYGQILTLAFAKGISELFILSTCNRTEIYGLAENADQLVDLLCTQTTGSKETFSKLCYIKKGIQAVQHLYEVGAGLESQILGDYEIIGQLKVAVKFSKQHGFLGSFTERLINSVLQSTKTIKIQTELSGGTVSVSFAAVQYIKRNVHNVAKKNILLTGIGKIGRNTCKNLVDYLNTQNITLINRTEEKAAELAGELGIHSAPIEALPLYVNTSDIILVATNAAEPTILKSHIQNAEDKLIIDLSIPYNVEKAVLQLPNVTLLNVDQLSKLKDETLQKRIAEVPRAKEIIAEHKAEFLDWASMRKNAPVIKAVKQKLQDMHQCQMFLSSWSAYPLESTLTVNQQAIQKVIKNMAVKMRQQNQPGCFYIEAINDFITTQNINAG